MLKDKGKGNIRVYGQKFKIRRFDSLLHDDYRPLNPLHGNPSHTLGMPNFIIGTVTPANANVFILPSLRHHPHLSSCVFFFLRFS
jgi:hypothetical protein